MKVGWSMYSEAISIYDHRDRVAPSAVADFNRLQGTNQLILQAAGRWEVDGRAGPRSAAVAQMQKRP